MCRDCSRAAEELDKHASEDIVEIETTQSGYTIFRAPNKDIGGYDYLSDSIGGGWRIVDSACSREELEVVIKDMKSLEKKDCKNGKECCGKCNKLKKATKAEFHYFLDKADSWLSNKDNLRSLGFDGKRVAAELLANLNGITLGDI